MSGSRRDYWYVRLTVSWEAIANTLRAWTANNKRSGRDRRNLAGSILESRTYSRSAGKLQGIRVEDRGSQLLGGTYGSGDRDDKVDVRPQEDSSDNADGSTS